MHFNFIQQFFFLGLLVGTTGIFFYMLGSYLVAVLWAIVIALVFYPVYERINQRCAGRSSLAALCAVGVVVLVVMIPFIFVGGMVVSESMSLYHAVNESENSFDSSSLTARIGQVTSFVEPYGISRTMVEERLRVWATSLSQVVATSFVSISQMTMAFLIQTVIMLYLLFFFFRDGVKIVHLVERHVPLSSTHERKLISRFSETTQAVVKGTLVIGIIQGVMGGVLFWAVGLSNPVLWGVAMSVLSVLPLVGAAVVWLPAAIILLLTGSIWGGVTILVVGGVLISSVDQFLRPVLVGRGAKMPDALVLLATVGGLATFGVNGFIIGPVIAALFLTMWVIFEEKYHTELTHIG